MDRIINTKTEKQSIYEIYRACRLCGAGAGYKMPIIQNVLDLDTSGFELRQKIRDCVQIEVHPDDKMPPLICELCVDKVNDFYDFIELCQRTNKRTRLRLGLPPQNSSRVANSDASSNSGDCILGVTEPVYQTQNEDSDEPLVPATRRKPESKVKIKKENDSSTKQKRPPTPPRATRNSKASNEDTISLSSLKQQQAKKLNKSSPSQPKSILKRDKKPEVIDDKPPSKPKRPREPPKPEVPQKKVKLAVSRPPKPPRARAQPPPQPPPRPSHYCRICDKAYNSGQAMANHLRVHRVSFTSAKRIANNECLPWEEVPDKECAVCWKRFPTQNLLQLHHCGGEDARPGGKCSKCKRSYALLKNLKKHELTCTSKRKGGPIVDPGVRARLLPAQVRIVRCDNLLLERRMRKHYDVCGVKQNYGLDSRCHYPYLYSFPVRTELPRDSMVKIKAEIDDLPEDFVHWDSDTEEEGAKKTVDSLSNLALKKIFSKQFLGKVPRKRRKVKLEKSAFDSPPTNTDFDSSMSRDISDIINNLNWDDNNDKTGSEEESLLTNYMLFDNETSNDVKKDVGDSNDSQSLLDKVSDDTKCNENNVSSQDTIFNKETIDNNTMKETIDSKLSENIDNDESKLETNAVNDTITHSNDEERDMNTVNNVDTIKSKDNYHIKNSTGNDKSIQENINENSVIDRIETNSSTKDNIAASSNNDCNDIESLNQQANSINNDSGNTKNDSRNTNNDTPNNDSENANNDSESVNHKSDTSSERRSNGEKEEKSDKLSFGDMNDISDTEVDDKKLMDALNEQLGEINNDITQNNDLQANGNGADINIYHKTTSNDHENEINYFIHGNNDCVNENNDNISSNISESNDKNRNVSETDKISLEDLLPPKSVAKSMDLDSISDEEFDFDTC